MTHECDEWQDGECTICSHGEINPELWSAIMGSAWEDNSWYRSVEYLHGADWDKPGAVRIAVDDPEKDGVRIVCLSPSIIMQSWEYIRANYRLSAGEVPDEVDMIDLDSGDGDLVIQYAVFEKIVYG